jgi:hypothetical protein
MEHPSQTQLYWRGGDLVASNAVGAFRWNALGSPAFERMVFNTLREFGVSVYAQEDGPKNGAYAPSFHIGAESEHGGAEPILPESFLDHAQIMDSFLRGANSARRLHSNFLASGAVKIRDGLKHHKGDRDRRR